MFGVLSRNFVAARHPFRKQVSRCIQSTSFRHRNHFFDFCNEHAQSTTLGPQLMFGVVSRNFVAVRHPFPKRVSGCIQSTSFCHRNQFFVFRNEHSQSSTLGPKLMFGVVSRYIVAARHPFRKRLSGCIKHEFLPPEPFLRFSQRTCPIHYFRSKTHVWGGFAQFRCRTSPIPKTTVGCIQSMSFRHRNHIFVFRNEHAQSTTLCPKLMCGVVSRNFVVVHHPFPKRVSGCIQSTSFCHRNQFFVFRNEHAQSLMCTRWVIARSFDERVWNNSIGGGDDVHGPTTAFQ
jgi:hypothetical protein